MPPILPAVRRIVQQYPSHGTSLNQVPRLFTAYPDYFLPGTRNIDIGGGRYNLATQMLGDRGVQNYVFDPFNRVSAHNYAVFDDLVQNGPFDTASVANVLNVIQESAARGNVINQAARAIRPDGRAYFQIYEGPSASRGMPRQTTETSWQNFMPAQAYVDEIGQYFGDVRRSGNIISAGEPLDRGPAQWLLSDPRTTGDTGSRAGTVLQYGAVPLALEPGLQDSYSPIDLLLAAPAGIPGMAADLVLNTLMEGSTLIPGYEGEYDAVIPQGF